MSFPATISSRPAELVGELISPQLAKTLIRNFKNFFPVEKGALYISKNTFQKATQGLSNLSGFRFMYGLEVPHEPASKVILLIPCNNTSSHMFIPNTIVQPEGYFNHRGERVSIQQTWTFLYNHAVHFSGLQKAEAFHKVIRGAFFGIDSIEMLLACHTNSAGLYYHFGYDPSEDGAAAHKPVLIPTDWEGRRYELYMDISKLCPPACGGGYGEQDDNVGDESCLLTDILTRQAGRAESEKELNTYRQFRDHYLHSEEGGPLVEMYYYISPSLIEAISGRKDAAQIYENLYRGEISQCHQLISEERFDEARLLFEATIDRLMKAYLFSN